jgi:hypothetical protein
VERTSLSKQAQIVKSCLPRNGVTVLSVPADSVTATDTATFDFANLA